MNNPDATDPKTAASNAGKALRAFRGKTGAPPSAQTGNTFTKKAGPPAVPDTEPKGTGAASMRSRLSRFSK